MPVSTREEARGSRPHSEEPRFRDEDPILFSQERFFGVPMASQEQGFSIGKARGTPVSCHHFKSPPDVAVHFRGNRFPSTASTFTPRIHSHHGGMWDSPVRKPRGKATDPLIAATGRGGALHRKGERNSWVVPPFQESPRCLSPFQRILFYLHCFNFHAEN